MSLAGYVPRTSQSLDHGIASFVPVISENVGWHALIMHGNRTVYFEPDC